MEKKLNLPKIQASMEKRGLSQADLARKLEVSRTSISKWLTSEKFPRPNKLLKLGVALGLPYEDLIKEKKDSYAPKIAFRKKTKRKTRDHHVEQAQQMGQMLEQLSRYLQLDEDKYLEKTTLRNPIPDYRYVQTVAARIREEIGIEPMESVKFEKLVGKFNNLGVILIPVLWGDRELHDNGLCIFLPRSKTTWVYLNLDAKIHDFKFWMTHELGHVLSPNAEVQDDVEKFTDMFAQAVLFPEACAEQAYYAIKERRNQNSKVSKILEFADDHFISPYTIYKSVNSFAEEHHLKTVNINPGLLFGALKKLNERRETVTEILSGSNSPSPKEYIGIAKERFESPFFDVLKRHLSEHETSPGFVQAILNTTLLDAKAIYQELV